MSIAEEMDAMDHLGLTPSYVQIPQVPALIPHSFSNLWFNMATHGACSGQRIEKSSSYSSPSKLTSWHPGFIGWANGKLSLRNIECSSYVLTNQVLPKPERERG